MRILFTGAGGMLGNGYYQTIKENKKLIRSLDIKECLFTDLNKDADRYITCKLDVRDRDSYFKIAYNFQPTHIFHLAAYTDLEYCEDYPDDAYITNSHSVEIACQVSESLGCELVYISTAGTVDGKEKSYPDWFTANPLSVYGKSKWYGEEIVRASRCKFYIHRAGWMMGGGIKHDKKFIGKIIRQIKDGKSKLYALSDVFGTPTYTYDFARISLMLVHDKYYGTANISTAGIASRYDVASLLLELIDAKDCELIEATGDFFAATYYASRPQSEAMDCTKIEYIYGNDIRRDWQVCLKEYVARYLGDI